MRPWTKSSSWNILIDKVDSLFYVLAIAAKRKEVK
jgi:hypothetical protein